MRWTFSVTFIARWCGTVLLILLLSAYALSFAGYVVCNRPTGNAAISRGTLWVHTDTALNHGSGYNWYGRWGVRVQDAYPDKAYWWFGVYPYSVTPVTPGTPFGPIYGTDVLVPLWPMIVVAAIPTLWWWSGFVRERRRWHAGRCSCGYELSGLAISAACPECGQFTSVI